MAETPSPPPSPYAPGIISEERTPPRPAGRPVVLLVASFVLILVTTPSFWWQWAWCSTPVDGHARSMMDLFIRVPPGAANVLILASAYVSDRVALWGTRREGYLLLCGLTMTITWVVLAVVGTGDVVWVLAVVEFSVIGSVLRAAVAGGLAEIGQRRAATGRLSAGFLVANQVAFLAATPLAAVFTIAPGPLMAGIAAGLSAAIVILITTVTDDGARAPEGPAIAPFKIWQFLRSRTFWSVVCVGCIAGLATVPRELIVSHLWATHSDTMTETSGRLRWIEGAVEIAAALGYLFVCRRAPLRRVLRISLFANALVLIAFERTLKWGGLDVAAAAVAASHGIVIIAILDLVLRAAPRGREAFGAILLGSLPMSVAYLLSYFAARVEAKAAGMAWFAAAAAIAGGLAVSLLPRALVATRDGWRVEGTQ